MSMNCIFGFSTFLLLLVALNIYFFYIIVSTEQKTSYSLPLVKSHAVPSITNEINDYVNRLPSHYHIKNPKFATIQRNLRNSFHSFGSEGNSVWNNVDNWVDEESLFPQMDGAAGQILQALRSSQIINIDNAKKGTQLKLLVVLEGQKKLFFKPKRYNISHIVKGNIYAGFDRHNSEVFAYYLAMVLNYNWVAPAVIRRIHVNELIPYSTQELKDTMIKNDKGSTCFYGKCYYCKVNETVCPNGNGEIEGAAVLLINKVLKGFKSPWRRSYTSKKMEWEVDNNFCKKYKLNSKQRIFNVIDVAIIDFLIQNGDRHRYELYNNKIVLLDNGKGLGNPMVDELDILAPLYQCCIISSSTWQRLELVSGGSLTDTIKLLASFQDEQITTEDHYRAVERRLLKVYAAVHYCIGKYGRNNVVIKNN